MEARQFNSSTLRDAMRGADEMEAEHQRTADMYGKPAAPTPMDATEARDRMIEVHRASIERYQGRVLAVRRECSIAVRDLDDELFEAERTFLDLKGQIERRKAEAEAKAAREIEANRQMAKASQSALIALTSAAEA